MEILPAKVLPYVKGWISLIGVIVAAVTTAVDSVPRWVTVVGAVVASLGVYLGANRTPDGQNVHEVAKSAAPPTTPAHAVTPPEEETP